MTMSNLLFDERPMLVIPKLAAMLGGSDRAIILQQLHYWLLKSDNVHDGRHWVYNTMSDWHKQFYWIKSVNTVSNHFSALEKMGIVVVGNYNKAGFDRTKWYSIDYDQLSKIENAFTKNWVMDNPKIGECSNQKQGNANTNFWGNNTIDYSETTSKSTQEKIYSRAEPDGASSHSAEIESVVDYLNQKAAKHYKSRTNKTRQLIRARFKEGFTLDDFKTVIDKKCSQWLNDPKMDAYLRPETLFGTKFEGYLNEKVQGQPVTPQHDKSYYYVKVDGRWTQEQIDKAVKKLAPQKQIYYSRVVDGQHTQYQLDYMAGKARPISDEFR